MTYKTIPINVAGGSYQDRSRPLSSQETRNFYHEVVEQGTDKFVLKSFPGHKFFGSSLAGNDRGATVMAEVGYRVLRDRLYSVSSIGNHTEIGTIPGVERCIFANDGENLFINTDQNVYWYNGSTVVQVTDSNIVNSKSVTYINNQFIYSQDQLFVVSDVGDGASASGLNAANSEVLPDKLIRVYAFDQIVYMFGAESVETWYNSGTGSPPFARIDGQLINIGCAAKHSVANTPNAIYWLGSDRAIYRARGGAEDKVSSTAISNAIEGYTVVSDAFAYTFSFQGKDFYCITFPSEDQTWCLNEELGINGWFELSAGTNGGRYNISDLIRAYGKNLVTDQTTGDMYELDIDTFDSNGSVIQRRRVMGAITGEKVGMRGRRLKMSRFELIMEKGVGLIDGQGEDPLIMIEASYDGGKSWTTGTWMRVGRLGETNIRAEWFNVWSFYSLIIRITTTDPVDYNIYSGAIDIKGAGR
jgi:hypothetical protein